MATNKRNEIQQVELSERVLLDSSAPYVHPDMESLREKLSKAQGDTLGKLATALRGFSLWGFSVRVHATPQDNGDDTPYDLRIVLEYNATVRNGIHYERVRGCYMDAAPDAPSAKVDS